jgi:hypothetical protein
MTATRGYAAVREFDDLPSSLSGLRSVVSLHAHTHHSREVLDDLPAYIVKLPLIGELFLRELQSFADRHGAAVDFSKGWWHPPVSPREVFESEIAQIEERFALDPIVSISDHDDIAACLELRALYADHCTPISLEWTVPFRKGYFHLGVHNLPAMWAESWFHRLRRFTTDPSDDVLEIVLEDLNDLPDLLVVFNHPCWDLADVGREAHASALHAFLDRYRRWLHAVEFNGYRSRRENNSAIAVAERVGLPVVSGGDRHGRAVNAVVNVTAARSFGEFAAEVRAGVSHVVVMPEYRQHLVARTMACAADVLGQYPLFPAGRQRWTDRVSCLSEGGIRPLSFHWPHGGPLWVRSAIGTFRVLASPTILPLVTRALDRVNPEGMGA